MKTAIAIVSGAIGIVMLAGAVKELKATTTGGTPPAQDIPCYHNLWTCSYEDNNAYWTGCDPNGPTGEITTAQAMLICTTYNDS